MQDIFNMFVFYVEQADKFTTSIYLILAKIVGAVVFFPGTPLTLLSGVVLGTFWGSVVAIIGNTLGAMAAFLLARYFLKSFVQNKILKKYPKINEYEDKLFKNGLLTVIFLRLIPVFPFNALNFVLGVTEVKTKDYFLGTLVGIIPGTVAFVYFGESIKMLSWFNISVAIFAIVCLSFLGKFWKLK